MALFSLDNGCVSLVVSSLGGSVLKFTAYTPEESSLCCGLR